MATKLAAEGARITALHVMEEIPAYITNEMSQELLANRRTQAEEEMSATVSGHSGVTPVVIFGHAGRTLLDYAHEHKVDCIVLSSHRPGLQDYFLGSTAQRVVRHAACSVHVMR